MSVIEEIQTALTNGGFSIEAGKYSDADELCGKIIFTGKEAPKQFFGEQSDFETFKVVVRGNSHCVLEAKIDWIKDKLRSAGFIQTSGYEDIEPKEGETFMQLAVNFKSIK